jgi:lipopolysaccharide transport system ATP-binding protein
MAVRLAFSVAAHLEPEILIVDEVLAVGDAEFQKKCLGKMNEVSKKEGRTILFVSHNMAAVEHLCTRALLLNEGRMVRQGHVSEVVSEYLHAGLSHVGSNGGTTLATGVFLRDFRLQETNIQVFDDLEYEIKIESARPNSVTELVILIYNHLNERVGVVDLRHKELPEKSLRNSGFTVRGKIKHLPLIEGTYHCGLFISCLLCRGDFFNLASFEVHRSEFDFVPYSPNHRGYLEFDNSFTVD